MQIQSTVYVNGEECVLDTDGNLYAITKYVTDGKFLTKIVIKSITVEQE